MAKAEPELTKALAKYKSDMAKYDTRKEVNHFLETAKNRVVDDIGTTILEVHICKSLRKSGADKIDRLRFYVEQHKTI